MGNYSKRAKRGENIICCKCLKMLPYTDEFFCVGEGHRCRKCSTATRHANSIKANPGRVIKPRNFGDDRIYGTGVKSGYRTTVGIAKKMQSASCELCGKPPPNHIDHCHATGKIRGSLCAKCNMLVGYIDTAPELLKKALLYVTKHRA